MPRLSSSLQPTLLAWSRTNLRDLPWRRTRDPWSVLVAEAMLQQTQVTRVIDRWVGFLVRFPDPAACARASVADVLREWKGLGYNRRALMLHRAATEISDRYGGVVPSELNELLTLPGVGAYTARAIQAFAFEAEAAPVDTNIGRVLARLGHETLKPRAAQRLADDLVPAGDVWHWNQGLMELGALVCTKRSPSCGSCPVEASCAWRGEGPDPADGSAAVSRPQARFEGSDRQLRGQVIDLLRAAPRQVGDMARVVAPDDDARRERIVERLVGDGLVERDGDTLRLAGDRVGSEIRSGR